MDPFPPGSSEMALVNDPAGQPGADQRQKPVAIFGAQVMASARFANACQTVQPVHPIQALDDRDAAAAGSPQTGQIARATDHQHRLIGGIRQMLANVDATRLQTIDQLVLE